MIVFICLLKRINCGKYSEKEVVITVRLSEFTEKKGGREKRGQGEKRGEERKREPERAPASWVKKA